MRGQQGLDWKSSEKIHSSVVLSQKIQKLPRLLRDTWHVTLFSLLGCFFPCIPSAT
jgi:hypothetical protein